MFCAGNSGATVEPFTVITPVLLGKTGGAQIYSPNFVQKRERSLPPKGDRTEDNPRGIKILRP